MRNDGNLDDHHGLGGPADRSDDVTPTNWAVSGFKYRFSNALSRLAGLGGLDNQAADRRRRNRMTIISGAACCLGLVGFSLIPANPAGQSPTPDQRAEIAQRAEADAASRGKARESVAPVTESPAPSSSPSPTAEPTPSTKPTRSAKATAKPKPKPKRITPVAGLDQAQMDNATAIVRAGQKMDVPRRALVIAVATAMQESNLYNYASGVLPESQNYPHQAIGWDHDSVGLFQQRPSTGWGAVPDLMKPEYATQQFLTALLEVPGWQDLPLTVAAQTVQVSAFGWLYAQHEWRATEVVDAVVS